MKRIRDMMLVPILWDEVNGEVEMGHHGLELSVIVGFIDIRQGGGIFLLGNGPMGWHSETNTLGVCALKRSPKPNVICGRTKPESEV